MTGADYRTAIGRLVSQLRQNHGLTQADLAKLLRTSQSAINRIEHGVQNVSLDILAKLSDALDSDLILLGSPKRLSLRVNGGFPLSGKIDATALSKYQILTLGVLNRITHSALEFDNATVIDSLEWRVISKQAKLDDVEPYITPISHRLLSLLDRPSIAGFSKIYSSQIAEYNLASITAMLARPSESYLIDTANTNRQYKDFYTQLKYCGAQIETYHEI